MQLVRAAILLSVLSTLTTLTEGHNKSCANDLETLEVALLQTGNNRVELLKAFYPPRRPPATFVIVNYTFLDMDSNITCQTKWLWSSREFYLIQPPSIIQLMSLYFTIPKNTTTTANITFQNECRDLVTWNEDSTCTCTSNSLLDILTQRLKSYAMFNNPDDIKIDDISLGTAICEDEHEMEYDDQTVRISLSLGTLVPFIVIILLAVMVWSSRTKMGAAMNKEQNHANVAAFALTGLVFSTFVVVLDIEAWVLVVQEEYEFTNYSIFRSLNFVKITTVIDIFAVLVLYIILPLCLACGLRCKCLKKKKEGSTQCCCHKWYCYKCCIENCSQPTCTLWLVASTCFAPLLCIASHSEYITIAWLSDNQHPGPVTYLYIISFFYYFISFRQLYKLCSSIVTACCKKCRKNTSGYEPIPESTNNPQEGNNFNLLAFIIEIPLGSLLVGAEYIVLYSLTAFLATAAAPTGVYFTQLAILIITGLFTYNFIYTEDRSKQFIKAFVETYRNEPLCLDNLPNAKKAGKVFGKLAFTITRQYTEDESQQLMEAFAENYKATNPDEILDASTDAESIGKVFGRLVYAIKHTDRLMEAFVKNFKATNSEALRLAKRNDAAAAGKMLGELAFAIMNQYTEDESKQLLKTFVENFKDTNPEDLHLDNLHNAIEARKVFGELVFEIIQQCRPNGQDPDEEAKKLPTVPPTTATPTTGQHPDEEARQLREVFVKTFEELHLASLNLNDTQIAGKVLGRLAVTYMKNASP